MKKNSKLGMRMVIVIGMGAGIGVAVGIFILSIVTLKNTNDDKMEKR